MIGCGNQQRTWMLCSSISIEKSRPPSETPFVIGALLFFNKSGSQMIHGECNTGLRISSKTLETECIVTIQGKIHCRNHKLKERISSYICHENYENLIWDIMNSGKK